MYQNQINQMNNCYEEDEINLKELFNIILKYKKFIFIFTFIVTFATLIYVLNKPNIYKVSILLAPQEKSKSLNLGGLGALASIAGVNIGGSSGVTAEIAFKSVLDNYVFMKNFIKKYNLVEKLTDPNLAKDFIFAFNNNSVYKFFHPDKKDNTDAKMTIYDIYQILKKSIHIEKDKKSGLITISCMHSSRKLAYEILDNFLKESTAFLVKQNLTEINNQIKKYKYELQKTNNLELKSELAKLISNLIKQKVFINTSKYYKVKIITEPYIPDIKDKIKPKRGLILIVGLVTSIILSIFLVFFIEFIKSNKENSKVSK